MNFTVRCSQVSGESIVYCADSAQEAALMYATDYLDDPITAEYSPPLVVEVTDQDRVRIPRESYAPLGLGAVEKASL